MATTGSCNCGGVAFTISQEVSDVYVCHCSICRKSTGSGGIAVAVVRNHDFSWDTGQNLIENWRKPEHQWEAYFCRVCGSRAPGKNSEDTLFVPVGLLDSGLENLKVTHHLFVDSKAQWEVIGDDGKQHKGAFEAPI